MMQQSFGPGQPPGAPQMVPGGQDLSRYAGVSPQGGGPLPAGAMMPTTTPPPSILASLGPAGQPQPQMQAPQPTLQDRLTQLMRTNPGAALAVQKQMQAQQLNALTMQEKSLDMGVKVSEAIERQLRGVTDQASLDEARERVRLIHPEAAAQIPQVYSKEAVAAIQSRGVAMLDQAKTKHYDAQSRKLDVESSFLHRLQDRIGQGDGTAPAGRAGGGETAQAPAGSQPRPAPAEYESAITDANRLYPQVKPERIKSMIAAESNFDAKAVSSAGAKGPMQLMDSTAKDMGVDDPFDIKQNVRGGTRYYAQMLTKYGGDERKALAAYNWGPANLDKVGGDVSKAPPETQAYVQKVLGGGGPTGTAQATDPRIAQLERKIASRAEDAQLAAAAGNAELSQRFENDAKRLTDEKNRLIDASRHQQERAEETPRAVARTTAETEAKQDLERKRQAGPLLPEERRKAFGGLRGDILKEPTFKTYQDVRNGYQNVKIGAASDSAQGDLAIFNGLAKILDPTSSVMSGEAKNIEEAQGQLQMWFNSPAKFLEGDRISKENRPRFLKMAYDLAKEKLTTAQSELKTVWGPIAKESQIDFDQLVPLPDLKPIGPGPNIEKFDKLLAK